MPRKKIISKNKSINKKPLSKQRCTRGKKICTNCNQLNPIHCKQCKNCHHVFHMKIKEPTPDQSSLFDFNFMSLKKSVIQPAISLPDLSSYLFSPKNSLNNLLSHSFQEKQIKSSIKEYSFSERQALVKFPQIKQEIFLKSFDSVCINNFQVSKNKSEEPFPFCLFQLPNTERIISIDWNMISPDLFCQYLGICTENSNGQTLIYILQINYLKTSKMNETKSILFEECFLKYVVSIEGENIADFKWLKNIVDNNLTNSSFIGIISNTSSSAKVLVHPIPSPNLEQHNFEGELQITPTLTYEVNFNSFTKLEILPISPYNTFVVSDKLFNILLFKLIPVSQPKDQKNLFQIHLIKIICNAHQMEISDLKFMLVPQKISQGNSKLEFKTYIGSCSKDGLIKVWSPDSPYYPVYQIYSSKKWVYNIEWDLVTQTLFSNSEGKNASHGIITFSSPFPANKKYKLGNQTTLMSSTTAASNHVLTSSIDGYISILNKQKIISGKIKSKKKEKIEHIFSLKKANNNTNQFSAYSVELGSKSSYKNSYDFDVIDGIEIAISNVSLNPSQNKENIVSFGSRNGLIFVADIMFLKNPSFEQKISE